MQSAQFIKLVTIASWLWVSQGNIAQSEQMGLIAQASTACTVDSLTAGDLSTISSPPTGLTGNVSISITCPRGATGSLQLTLTSPVVYNGGAKMKFASKSGVLSRASTSYSTSIITVPISSGTGNGVIQVDLAATNSKLLKSATDYKLVVAADFIN
jgi:hypothetical protein